MPQIASPEERTFCAMNCGNYLVHTPQGTRAYPDLCTECEKKIITGMEKRGRLSEKFVRSLKR